jgi:ribosomal protein L7/L12
MANEANSIAELSFTGRIWKIAPWIAVVAICGAFAAFSLAQYESTKAKQSRELSDVQKILSDLIAVKTGPLVEAKEIVEHLKVSTDPSTKSSANQLASKLEEISSKLFNVRDSLSNLNLADAGMGIIGAALANGANDTQRAVGASAILIVIIMMTAGCFFIILFSKNKPAVGYAIDALKVFGGFFIGVANTFFK